MKDYITIDGTRVPMTNSMKELGKMGKEVRRRARIIPQGPREGRDGQPVQLHPLRAGRRQQ